MDPLINDLRDLDPPAPAPAIDLDRVIARGLRRRTYARVGAAFVATLGVLGMAAAAFALRPAGPPVPLAHHDCAPVPTVVQSVVPLPAVSGEGGPPPSALPSGSASIGPPAPGGSTSGASPLQSGRVRTSGGPTQSYAYPSGPAPRVAQPSERPEAAVPRLTAALRTALRQAFPGALIVRADTCDEGWSMARSQHGYTADLEVYDAGGLQRLSVRVRPEGNETVYSCDEHGKCTAGYPPGPVTFAFGSGPGGSAQDIRAGGRLADTTWVEIDLSTYRVERNLMIVTRQGPSIAMDDLKQIGVNPGLTLYP